MNSLTKSLILGLVILAGCSKSTKINKLFLFNGSTTDSITVATYIIDTINFQNRTFTYQVVYSNKDTLFADYTNYEQHELYFLKKTCDTQFIVSAKDWSTQIGKCIWFSYCNFDSVENSRYYCHAWTSSHSQNFFDDVRFIDVDSQGNINLILIDSKEYVSSTSALAHTK